MLTHLFFSFRTIHQHPVFNKSLWFRCRQMGIFSCSPCGVAKAERKQMTDLSLIAYSPWRISICLPDTVTSVNSCTFRCLQDITSVKQQPCILYMLVFHRCSSAFLAMIESDVGHGFNQSWATTELSPITTCLFCSLPAKPLQHEICIRKRE